MEEIEEAIVELLHRNGNAGIYAQLNMKLIEPSTYERAKQKSFEVIKKLKEYVEKILKPHKKIIKELAITIFITYLVSAISLLLTIVSLKIFAWACNSKTYNEEYYKRTVLHQYPQLHNP